MGVLLYFKINLIIIGWAFYYILKLISNSMKYCIIQIPFTFIFNSLTIQNNNIHFRSK
jgi:hypothetical protein